MKMLSVLHKPVQGTQTKWHTVKLGAVMYDTRQSPWNELDGVLVEEIAELLRLDSNGPTQFGTVTYPWGCKGARLGMRVPTVQYWVCQGAKWG